MILLAIALAAPGDGPKAADTLTGKVRLTTGPAMAVVWLVSEAGEVKVEGELASEVARLQSAKLEIVGKREGDTFHVQAYRILDIGGGAPLVGELLITATGYALRDGSGAELPLSLNPRGRERLYDQAGAKLWVVGTPLVSGELKVLRYGILREAKPPSQPLQQE